MYSMETQISVSHNYDYNFKNADERSAEERAIDDWAPVTTSRTEKWWYSTIHNVTVIFGAGVLRLPCAMSELRWGPGATFMVISWTLTLYTLWQMVEMHEMVPGKRFERYHELGQHAFGEKLGLWIVVPLQLIVVVGVNIVYMITAGTCLRQFFLLAFNKEIALPRSIIIFASVHFLLSSQLPGFNSVIRVSLAAAVTGICYTTMAWGASLYNKGVQRDGCKSKSAACDILKSFSALGGVVFSFSAHNVVMEIQASMPSTREKPSKGPMWRGSFVAYIIVALCYFPVAFIGYDVLGHRVGENILSTDTLKKPRWLIAMANMFVVVHLIGSYQLYAMPVFDMIETMLVKKMKFRATWYLCFISRNIYVAFTMFIGIAIPFFGGLLGFVGGFAFAPTTYIFPCITWLVIRKPRRFTASWLANWVCIIFGVLLMVVGPIGGSRQMVLDAKHCSFFATGVHLICDGRLRTSSAHFKYAWFMAVT